MRCILCILSIFVGVLWAEEASKNVMLDEMKLAQEQLQRENDVLRQEIDRKDAEIAKLRSMYADAVLKTNATARRLAALEIDAVNLLAAKDDGQNEQLLDSLGVIAALRGNALEADDALNELQHRLNMAMDVLNPSSALREELKVSFAAAASPVKRSISLLAINNGNKDEGETTDGIEVAELDAENQVAYLRQGYSSGLRIGQTLCLKRGSSVVVRLRLVECRPDVSAGIVIDGNWNALYAGCRLQAEKSSR